VNHTVILCDFDGTISKQDVTDTLLEKFASPEWEEIETAWREGLINSHECMSEQYALVRASQTELDAFLKTIKIDPHFKDFLDYCRTEKHPLTVISDGFDYYIDRIFDNHGIKDIEIFSNHLEFKGGSIVTEFPHTNEECNTCGNCKTTIFHTFKTPENKIVYIGDGWSDRCIAHESDVIFAKHKLITYCHERGLDYTPYTTFADILKEMRTW